MLSGFYEAPPTYTKLTKAIEWLHGNYKKVKVFPIGKSVLGRDIPALSIGDPTGSTLYVGATHGLEWLTSMLLIRFCDNLLDAMENGRRVSEIDVGKALYRRSVTIIPCLNPDGVEIALDGPGSAGVNEELVRSICGDEDPGLIWQANANGVDINHNFDAGWKRLREIETESGITGPGPTRYGGEYPHSERETAAVTTFCMTFRPGALYSIHSQGEEIYYQYGDNTHPKSRMIAQILASSSGYSIAKQDGLASHGGLKDWFIEKFGRPGFTIEVGTGKNPLGLECLDKIYSRIEEMLVIAALL